MDFGRDICGNLSDAQRREWLVTNGIGGYAMGTIAGSLTRRYHGLLIAALSQPLGRKLLVAKLDETVHYDGSEYRIYHNHWRDGTQEPNGYRFLERFHLEGTSPVWSYAFSDAFLEKRVWMQPGANCTYLHYTLKRAHEPVAISARALVNFRDYHHTTAPHQWSADVVPVHDGLRILASEDAQPFFLLSSSAHWFPRHEWYQNFYLEEEVFRGQSDYIDANLYAGHCNFHLGPGKSATIVVSTESAPRLDGASAYKQRLDHEKRLLERATVLDTKKWSMTTVDLPIEKGAIEQLILAADQFIVKRSTANVSDGRSIIAGYPWFSDWGRDTMIALPGLALATGRTDEAAMILRTYAQFVDRGMLPNRFPDEGDEPEYNTCDATLWYFEAVRAYYDATGDDNLLAELYPVLKEIIWWHIKGTRFNIQLDQDDGLLESGQPGIQLTWMDAKVGDWTVTPRIGKPIEISALWYNALNCAAAFGSALSDDISEFIELAELTRTGFRRFWNEDAGYCYDVIDGPNGYDEVLRPNQLMAVSLFHSLLEREQQKAIVDICANKLLTSYGLRSLGAEETEYAGSYGGDQRSRDGAYHQGTVWAWLIGPFISAHLKVYGDASAALAFLNPALRHLSEHGIGTISEIFDGDPPHTPRGCPAQAWSVGEVLRVYDQLASFLESEKPQPNGNGTTDS